MTDIIKIFNEKYPDRDWDARTEEEEQLCEKEFNDKLQVGVAVVFYDQDGRNNPRFCKIVKRTPQYLSFQQHDIKSVDMHPDQKGYRSSTEHKLFPVWEITHGDPFRRKMYGRGKNNYYTIYDPNEDYIRRWYD